MSRNKGVKCYTCQHIIHVGAPNLTKIRGLEEIARGGGSQELLIEDLGGANICFHMCKSVQGSEACHTEIILKNSTIVRFGVYLGLFFLMLFFHIVTQITPQQITKL